MLVLLLNYVSCLAYKCNYTEISGPVHTSVLYKEESLSEVKWIEINEYCRAKGDTKVYSDAGQPKCEYSRDICKWNNGMCVVNELRSSDELCECQKLLKENTLVSGLDRGRLPE